MTRSPAPGSPAFRDRAAPVALLVYLEGVALADEQQLVVEVAQRRAVPDGDEGAHAAPELRTELRVPARMPQVPEVLQVPIRCLPSCLLTCPACS